MLDGKKVEYDEDEFSWENGNDDEDWSLLNVNSRQKTTPALVLTNPTPAALTSVSVNSNSSSSPHETDPLLSVQPLQSTSVMINRISSPTATERKSTQLPPTTTNVNEESSTNESTHPFKCFETCINAFFSVFSSIHGEDSQQDNNPSTGHPHSHGL